MNRRVLLVKGAGGSGLGDRLRAVLVGALCADASDRALVVDWRDGRLGLPGQDVFGELFGLEGLESSGFPGKSEEVEPEAWRGRLDRSLHDVYVEDGDPPWDRVATTARYSFAPDLLKSRVPVLVMWEFDRLAQLRSHLRAEWRDFDEERLLSTAWHSFLRPSPRLVAEVDRWAGGVDGERIGVHVRATREASLQKGDVRLSEYFDAIDRIRRERPRAEILLATDNAAVEGAFRERYLEIRIRPKWLPRPGDPIHLNQENPDVFEATLAAAVEMLALARCEWLVSRRNSSFSTLARIASRASEAKRVVLDVSSRWPRWSTLRTIAFGLKSVARRWVRGLHVRAEK